jgi:phage tail-like protein
MSRGLVPGLLSPGPIGPTLPGLYQEDEFTMRFVSAFDEALAPLFSTIDNFPTYLDPALTPEDFLDWLAGWVGVLLDETWPIERRRAFVSVAAQLYRQRGTAAGLAAQIRLFTAGEVEIIESGGSAWSNTADAAPPGTPDFTVTVRVKPPAKAKVDGARLEALVAAAKPAHVRHKVEIVTRST